MTEPRSDREQIIDLILLYSRGLDRMDTALLQSLFHPGATLDYGSGYAGSADDFVTTAVDALKALRATQHIMNNILVRVEGDRASAETYASNYHGFHADADRDDYITLMRYVDTFERRRGVWKFTKRQGVRTGVQVLARNPQSRTSVLPGGLPDGLRDRDDVSYRLEPSLNP